MDYFKVLKDSNKKELKKYIKSHTDRKSQTQESYYMSSDKSTNYIYNLMIELPGIYALTKSVSYVAYKGRLKVGHWPGEERNLSKNDYSSLEYNAILLSNTYKEIVRKEPDITGIYSIINFGDYEEKGIGHQNWLYVDFKNFQIIRFEPNGYYLDNEYSYRAPEFFNILCDELSSGRSIKWRWKMATTKKILNNFSGCRAVSTLMASMHIKKIEMSKLENLFMSNRSKTGDRTRKKYEVGNKNALIPFILKMQEEIYSSKRCNYVNFGITRSTRVNRTIKTLPYILVTKTKFRFRFNDEQLISPFKKARRRKRSRSPVRRRKSLDHL